MPLQKITHTVLLTILVVTGSIPLTLPLLELSGNLQVLAKSSKTPKSEAKKLFTQGSDLLENGNRRDSLPLLQEALALHRQLKNRSEEGKTLNILGNLYSGLPQFGSTTFAIGYQNQALKISKEIKDQDLEVRALLGLGMTGIDSVNYLQNALKTSQNIKNRSLETEILLNLGKSHLKEIKENDVAIDYFQKSLILAQEINDLKLSGKVIYEIQIFLYGSKKEQQKKQEYLLNFLQNRLVALRSHNNRYAEAEVLKTLGNYYAYSVKDKSTAVEYYKKSLDNIQLINIRPINAYKLAKETIKNLRSAYLEINPKSADKLNEYFYSMLMIARRNKNLPLESYLLTVLSSINVNKFTKKEELLFNQQGLEIALDIRHNELTEDILERFYASAYASEEDMVKYIQQQLMLSRQNKNYHAEVLILQKLGDIYSDDPIKAIEYYQKGLNISQRIQNHTLIDSCLAKISYAFFPKQQFKSAVYVFEQQMILAKKNEDYYSKLLIQQILEKAYKSLGTTEQTNYYKGQLTSARQEKDQNAEQEILRKIGQVYFLSQNYDEAFKYWQQQLAVIRSLNNSDAEMEMRRFKSEVQHLEVFA